MAPGRLEMAALGHALAARAGIRQPDVVAEIMMWAASRRSHDDPTVAALRSFAAVAARRDCTDEELAHAGWMLLGDLRRPGLPVPPDDRRDVHG